MTMAHTSSTLSPGESILVARSCHFLQSTYTTFTCRLGEGIFSGKTTDAFGRFFGHTFYTVYEQHGDFMCQKADGGTDCYAEESSSAEGNLYAKRVRMPMTVEAELNDVRAPGSPPLVWWYQLAAQWVPFKQGQSMGLRSLSSHYFWSPGQLYNAGTFLVPTDADSMIWYTGLWYESGTLVRAKMHCHASIFVDGFFFSARPADVGLGERRFTPTYSFKPLITTSLGFSGNDELREHIIASYQGVRSANHCPESGGGMRCPDLICHANATVAIVDGKPYDRRAPTHCKQFHFVEGQQFVSVGFNAVKHRSLLPDLGATAGGHLHWFWSWVPDDEPERSRFTYSFHAQDPAVMLGRPLVHGGDSHAPMQFSGVGIDYYAMLLGMILAGRGVPPNPSPEMPIGFPPTAAQLYTSRFIIVCLVLLAVLAVCGALLLGGACSRLLLRSTHKGWSRLRGGIRPPRLERRGSSTESSFRSSFWSFRSSDAFDELDKPSSKAESAPLSTA